MTTEAKMRDYIERVLASYRKINRERGPHSCNVWRHLGALEGALVVVGKLSLGQDFPCREVSTGRRWWFGKPGKRKETYREIIERLAVEWLAEHGIANGEGKA